MKYLLTILILSQIVACGPPKSSYLDKDDLLPYVSYQWEWKIPVKVKYYIIEPDQLLKARYPIVYIGSVDKYHLFNLAHKGPVAADEILHFAILKEHCIIDNPATPAEIQKRDEASKWVQIKNGKVVMISNNS